MGTTLTVLSYGAGQDSTTILHKLIKHRTFRNHYAPEDLIVVFADTKNEHPETYDHIRYTKRLCLQHRIPFFVLDPEEWSTGDWKTGLIGFYEAGDRIGSKAFPKSCTDKLKIQPIYKFLEMFIHENYNTKAVGLKRAIKEFTEANTLKVLLGIARGEEKRVAKANNATMPVWQRGIERCYPLIDIGYDRADCQHYLIDIGCYIPIPSNCILCPFMAKQELLLLHRTMPDWFDKWVTLEANKLDRWKHLENNLGVWGKKALPKVLEEASAQYGYMTVQDLLDYRFSHGHCVQSKY